MFGNLIPKKFNDLDCHHEEIVIPDEATEATNRHKRSIASSLATNSAYTMEVLVAVDKKMKEYHGDNLNAYVLTLMSIVSIPYHIRFIHQQNNLKSEGNVSKKSKLVL